MIRGLNVICSYYSYEDAPCPMHSLDIIGDRSLSLRLASNNNHSEDFKKQLRSDIAKIVRSYEKSKKQCEHCGAKGELRKDLPRAKPYVMTVMKSLIKSTHLTDNLYKRQDN